MASTVKAGGHYDVAIAYRIYPKVAKGAAGLPFSDDKYRMADVCLQSFRRSLGDLRVKVWVLLDGCPPSYGDLFRSCFSRQDLVLIPLEGVGNRQTFLQQINILSEQEDAELVYFAEDDYYYLPGQFHLMTDFLQTFADVDFVSPYDHLDCYTLDLHRRPKWLRVFADHHWRTAASTCLTFLTTRERLRETRRTFRSYSKGNNDCSLWLDLTKESLFRPVDFVRWTIRRQQLAKIVIKAWLFGLPQILFGRSYKLWVPIPGLATHMVAGLLSPTIDWQALLQNENPSVQEGALDPSLK
jgi:hypothetical protein